MRIILLSVFLLAACTTFGQRIWSAEQAHKWAAAQPWRTGCNFIPSTAINELEMWQAETWDAATIDRELGWAQSLGFNTVRVYLHNLAWETDADGFKKRMNEFLTIASSHGIATMFVLFDDCWNEKPAVGAQPAPRPGVHNSGWVQAPGKARVLDAGTWGPLKKYTQDILTTFAHDSRIVMWDLYNEPGNGGLESKSLPLLRSVFAWAWEVRPDQPLTCATWTSDAAFEALNKFQLQSSDVVTFHNYNDVQNLEAEILKLQKTGRPLLCSEYMARTNNSRFITHLPVFKKYKVGAINWGLVSGKTNTIYPWGSKEGGPEPAVWFHDIFRRDGSPYDAAEVALIRQLTLSK